MGHLVRDIRYAARLMVRKSGYSSLAVLTLALGIGASAAMFTRSIARGTALLVGVGGALGLVGAAALSRVVSSLVVGVSPFDPTVVVAAVALLVVVALAGCAVPARRAVRIQAVDALRHE